MDEQDSPIGCPGGSGPRPVAETGIAASMPPGDDAGLAGILDGLLHQLRPSLLTTLGFAELLRDPGLDAAGRSALLERLTAAGRRSGRMLEMVSELRRLTASGPRDADDRLDLLEELDRLLGARRECIEAPGLEVIVRSEAAVPAAFAVDAARMRLAVAAALDEAVAAITDGRLELLVGFDGPDPATGAIDPGRAAAPVTDGPRPVLGWLRIQIIASGGASSLPAMAAATAIPPATVADTGGLAARVALAAIRPIGGRLDLSRTGRPGLQVRLEVPATALGDRLVLEQGMPAPRPAAGDPASGTPLRRLRVIVAEGQPEPRWLLRAVLERAGAVVEEVADGAGLLEALARDPGGLLLLNLHLPGCDPREVVRGLRGQGVAAPVIAMSPSEPAEPEGLADAWLPTPVDPASLVETCARWRGRRHESPPGSRG